jgi:protease-4
MLSHRGAFFPERFMKKHPFLMALLTLGAIFLFFLILVVAVSGLLEHRVPFSLGNKIGVVEISGVIRSSKTVNRQIIAFRKDDSVKAIVLRIDSPGGIGPAQEIYEEVKKAAAVKPVVVSMGAVAASGGYYIAAPARRILADPGTITGSIGVIMELTNIQDLLGKIGLKNQVVKSGPHKDIGSAVRPMTDSDRKILQSVIDDTYQQFVAAVAQGRKLPVKKVRILADGRIYTGRQAKNLGLIDQLGDLQDAITVAAGLAGLHEEPRVVYPKKERGGCWNIWPSKQPRSSARVCGIRLRMALSFYGLEFNNRRYAL